MTACTTCGGQIVARDYDYGACCLQCGRPAVKPEPPAWLLQESSRQVERQNSGQYFDALVEREAKAIRLEFDEGKRVCS